MTRIRSKVSKFTSAVAALVLALGVAVPALFLAVPASAAEIQTRSIEMSSSIAGATASYVVTFTPETTEAGGVVYIDFCQNSPLEGDSCTDDAGTVPDVTNVTGPATTTAVSDGTTTHTVKITGQTLTQGSPYSVTLSNITNPTTAVGFYARIFTYATGGTYTPANDAVPTDTGYVDFGGIALTTTSAINIQARVQETLTFCVSAGTGVNTPSNVNGNTNPITTQCNGAIAPNIVIGDAGANHNVLDSNNVYVSSAYSQVSTNATNGVNIRAKIDNNCGALTLGGVTTCPTDIIPAVNGGATGTAAITAGTADFGLLALDGVPATGGSGTVSATSDFNDGTDITCGSTAHFGMNNSNTTGVTSPYGDIVEASTGPVNQVNNQYCFGATSSITTAAGVYSANIDLIATGTF